MGSKPASATSQSTAAEVEELRAQIHQLEQDVVSAALATNDEEVDALRQVRSRIITTGLSLLDDEHEH